MPLAANPFLQTPAVAASKAATGKAAQPDVEPVKTGGEPFSKVYAKASDATSGVTSSKPAITRDASNNSAANPPPAVADSGKPLPAGKSQSTDQDDAPVKPDDGLPTPDITPPAVQTPAPVATPVASSNAQVKVYDTNGQPLAALLTQAQQDGATLVVGPLLKDQVNELASDQTPLNVLALNQPETEKNAPNICYFALSPEDEAQDAARQVYEQAGISPQDVDVVELHDCFAQNELLTYEALGLCPVGGAEKFVCDGDNTYGGKFVTNPSGGLLSKGHPLGATGLAQCTELVQQLRGRVDQRQVANARLALQHNLGLGGACVVTLYERV